MEKTFELIEKNKDEMIEALQRVLRCPSEEGEPKGEYPFGEDVHKCFIEFLKLAEELGFQTENIDNYGGHVDWIGKGYEDGRPPKICGILGHLDVVPAGTGWDVEPYSGEIMNGYIYGRGTTDDKGPLISVLYAMKALKDAGYEPVDTIRIIVGLDEETGWGGIRKYFEKAARPDYGFTPDADFPVINGEMGIIVFELARKFEKSNSKGLELRSLTGGNAPNAVPANCRAVLRNISTEKSAQNWQEKVKADGLDPMSGEGLKAQLDIIRQECDSYRAGGRHAGLFPEKWLPAAVVVADTPFTEQNGMMNSTSKIVRGKVEKYYADRIEFAYTSEGKDLVNEKNIQSV